MPASVDPQRFERLRSEFPGTAAGPYLDTSARCLLYGGGRAAFDRYLDHNGAGTIDKAAMFAAVEKTRGLFARLIGASADEVAFTRNVTDAIATVAAALPWKAGENVVLCESIEHPANIFPWYGVAKRTGIAIKSVPGQDGHIPVEAILGAIDDATRVVAVSSVSFSPGFRLALGELGAACRARGVLLVVDGAQSVGVLDQMGTQIQWVTSYVTPDKIYCVYNAANADLVLEHARLGGFPADSVSPVIESIDPTTAEA